MFNKTGFNQLSFNVNKLQNVSSISFVNTNEFGVCEISKEGILVPYSILNTSVFGESLLKANNYITLSSIENVIEIGTSKLIYDQYIVATSYTNQVLFGDFNTIGGWKLKIITSTTWNPQAKATSIWTKENKTNTSWEVK